MTLAETALLRAIQMPIGMPTMMHARTASNVMMSVSMLSDHRSTMPKNSIVRDDQDRPAQPGERVGDPGRQGDDAEPADLGHRTRERRDRDQLLAPQDDAS